jgi:ribosomal protein L11 methyltransferase
LIRSKGFLEKKWFVLSGLLRSQAGKVADVLSKYPVKIVDKLEHGGIWHTFLGKICN